LTDAYPELVVSSVEKKLVKMSEKSLPIGRTSARAVYNSSVTIVNPDRPVGRLVPSMGGMRMTRSGGQEELDDRDAKATRCPFNNSSPGSFGMASISGYRDG
jgi:hypothetical protein